VRFFLHYGDLSDTGNIEKLINEISPDEVYNLGAQSHVRVSFDMPEFTANVDGLGVLRVLEAIKNSGKIIKFYQASSSEMFGAANPPQNELTPFQPQSPYACAKVLLIMLHSCIERPMEFLPAMESFLTNEKSSQGRNFRNKEDCKKRCKNKSWH